MSPSALSKILDNLKKIILFSSLNFSLPNLMALSATSFPPVLDLCVKKVCWYSEDQELLLISDVSYTVGVIGP